MSEALERVITEQQKEIDSLRKHNSALMESSRKAQQSRYEFETAFFKDIDKVLDFKLREYWKDDQKEAFQKYRDLLHDLRMEMLNHGWCIRCGDWIHQCGCHDE